MILVNKDIAHKTIKYTVDQKYQRNKQICCQLFYSSFQLL